MTSQNRRRATKSGDGCVQTGQPIPNHHLAMSNAFWAGFRYFAVALIAYGIGVGRGRVEILTHCAPQPGVHVIALQRNKDTLLCIYGSEQGTRFTRRAN